MTQKEITEGNRIIAEFMGVEKCNDKNHSENPCYYFVDAYVKISDAKYHTSWDWLMPVVEKIETRGIINVVILNHKCDIRSFNSTEMDIQYFKVSEGKSKIEATWLAVLEFINWHNQQT